MTSMSRPRLRRRAAGFLAVTLGAGSIALATAGGASAQTSPTQRCWAYGGVGLVGGLAGQVGDSNSCTATTGNRAFASGYGNTAQATSTGGGSTATANGYQNTAVAVGTGSNNHSTATGFGNFAGTGEGNTTDPDGSNNTSVADGFGNIATTFGSNESATATGGFSSATANTSGCSVYAFNSNQTC